jgi:hypothetical protein
VRRSHNVLTQSNLQAVIGDFHIETMTRYSVYVPRLYKLCMSLGFEAGKLMPSRAFCSDSSRWAGKRKSGSALEGCGRGAQQQHTETRRHRSCICLDWEQS